MAVGLHRKAVSARFEGANPAPGNFLQVDLGWRRPTMPRFDPIPSKAVENPWA